MNPPRILAAVGLVFFLTSISVAEPREATVLESTGKSVLSSQPRRLQVSSQSRPAAKRVAAMEKRPKAVPTGNVATTSFQEVKTTSTEVIYPAGEMVFDGTSGHYGTCCPTVCPPCWPNWFAGFEATFLMPRYNSNVAYTLTQSDGTSFETSTDVEFDSGLQFSPRVFAGFHVNDNIGFQVTYWRFDHDPDSLSVQPPANGFGSITPPSFGNVDISTTIPGETFAASSGLTAYTIDFEITKQSCIASWKIGVAGGVRYAEINQSYRAQTSDTTGTLSGQIDYQHGKRGFGPTLSLFASVPVCRRWSFFTRGRGSLVFGEATSTLNAGEDLDLTTPFTTTRSTNRDDLLAIGELQLGLSWEGPRHCRIWQPYATVAMEGQIWNGVGNAVSENGNLGFFGVVTSLGVNW